MEKLTGRASSIPSGLIIGALVSIGITVLVAAIGAHLVMNQYIDQDQIGYCSIAALILGTILGAITACKRIKHRKLMVCAFSGLAYYLLLLMSTALFYGGQYEGMGVTLLIVMLSTLAAALIVNREGKQKTFLKPRKI